MGRPEPHRGSSWCPVMHVGERSVRLECRQLTFVAETQVGGEVRRDPGANLLHIKYKITSIQPSLSLSLPFSLSLSPRPLAISVISPDYVASPKLFLPSLPQ